MSSFLKNIKYEYQHYISSINDSINISKFGGARYKKALGVEGKWGQIFFKNWVLHFFNQRQKSNTQAS